MDSRSSSRGRAYLTIAFISSLWLTLAPVQVSGEDLSGKEVVDAVCVACHATGAEGAPQIGDEEAWRNRASQGLSNLTLHALDGIRNMPAHGGRPDLSDLEIARAVTHMVNLSGGNWVEPARAEDLSAERSGEQIVKAQCINCHGEGVDGAPKVGDIEAWVPRMNKGLAYLLRSAIHGHGGMPPRGGQANLSDTELRSAILYLYNPAGMPAATRSKPKSASTGPGSANPNHRSVGGVDIYLGFIPAKNLQGLPKDSPERAMHGGIPRGAGHYHVNVSLYDKENRSPVNDARIQLQYGQPALATFTTRLEPMAIGSGSYGNYIRPKTNASNPYLITLRIDRPGARDPIEATFEHTFE